MGPIQDAAQLTMGAYYHIGQAFGVAMLVKIYFEVANATACMQHPLSRQGREQPSAGASSTW